MVGFFSSNVDGLYDFSHYTQLIDESNYFSKSKV